MNRRIFWTFAVLVTVFALSLNSFAQPPGGGQGRGQGPGMGMGGMPGMGGPGGGMGGVGAVFQNQEAFARELGLTPQQATELQGIMRESMETFRTQFQNAPRPEPGADPEAMRQFGETMRQRMESGMNEVQARVDQVLRPEQRTKLRETSFQLAGGLDSPMLGTPMGERMLETLDLTDSQKEQVRKLVEERNAAMRNFGEVNWRDQAERERFQADMAARGARFAEQVKAILTPEQRAKADRLTAEAPALRERLGVPAPGQPRGQQGQQGRQQAPGGGFVPGQGSWRPGQDVPDAPPPSPRRGNFPRGEN